MLALLAADATGPERRNVLGASNAIEIVRLAAPERAGIGRLEWIGGWTLTSPDQAFGGVSAMVSDGGGLLLVSDGGNIVRLALDARGAPSAARFGDLRQGPGGPVLKRDRDSEAATRAGAAGPVWVGFEFAHEIWRYGASLTPEARAKPRQMRSWPGNGGAEAMARLRDGRFVVFGERRARPAKGSPALLFDRDPTDPRTSAIRFGYRPPAGYSVTDAALLPNGTLLLLHRRIGLWPLLSAKLALLDPAAIREGRTIAGLEIATLAPPLPVDNMEGLAVTREGRDGGETIVWIVSDDNFGAPLQRTLLLKFRLLPAS